jgi:hypothetical protein
MFKENSLSKEVAAIFGLLLLTLAGCGQTPPLEPSVFHREFRQAAAKISFFGDQKRPIATVLFQTEDVNCSVDAFRDVQKGVMYLNDEDDFVVGFTVTLDEFRRMLEAVKDILIRGANLKNEDRAILSFSILQAQGAELEGAEFRFDRSVAVDFYPALLDAIDPQNVEGRRLLRDQYEQIVPSSARKKPE